jgi:hypothetical protein
MLSGFITITIIVALTRIYKIYKNGGVTDIQTEVFEAGSHMVASSIVFIAIMAFLM